MYADNFTVVDCTGGRFAYVSNDKFKYAFSYVMTHDSKQTGPNELHIMESRDENPPRTICVHYNPRQVIIFYDR